MTAHAHWGRYVSLWQSFDESTPDICSNSKCVHWPKTLPRPNVVQYTKSPFMLIRNRV